MSFQGHSCPSIMIICIQPQTCASGRGNGLSRFFVFLSNWDGAPLGVGALRKLRTLCIGSGGTAWFTRTRQYFNTIFKKFSMTKYLSFNYKVKQCSCILKHFN